MKMELGEHPRKFLLWVDQMVKELEKEDRPVDSKDVDIVILIGLAHRSRFECSRALRTGPHGTRSSLQSEQSSLQSEQSTAPDPFD